MALATLNAINIPSDRFRESISEIQTDILAGQNLIRQTVAIDISKRFNRIIRIDWSTSGNGNIAQSLGKRHFFAFLVGIGIRIVFGILDGLDIVAQIDNIGNGSYR